MSEANIEVVRQMTDRFNRARFLPEDLFDPDVELFNIRESPLPGPYHGYEGFREWREGVFDVVGEGRFEVDNFRDVDEADLVIYRIRLIGRARHTGLEIDLAWTNVNWFRDGRIYLSKSVTHHAEALEAAGLSE